MAGKLHRQRLLSPLNSQNISRKYPGKELDEIKDIEGRDKQSFSEQMDDTRGVAQSCVLGPMFNILINELLQSESCQVTLADGTNVSKLIRLKADCEGWWRDLR